MRHIVKAVLYEQTMSNTGQTITLGTLLRCLSHTEIGTGQVLWRMGAGNKDREWEMACCSLLFEPPSSRRVTQHLASYAGNLFN